MNSMDTMGRLGIAVEMQRLVPCTVAQTKRI